MMFLIAICAYSLSYAQSVLTKYDSGWVSLFNGVNFDSLYIRTNQSVLQNPLSQKAFKIEAGGIIHVMGTGNADSISGHCATKKVYSRYQVRVQYRYPAMQPTGGWFNSGILYHIVSADYVNGGPMDAKITVPYVWNSYPKCIEFQLYRQHGGNLLGIKNVWATSPTIHKCSGSEFTNALDSCNTYSPSGTHFTAFPAPESNPVSMERRIFRSHDAAGDDKNWVQAEAYVYGADSVVHRINGQVVLRAYQLKTNDSMQNSGLNDPNQKPMDRGHIALQAENSEVFYRFFELRELRADGSPLIRGCRDPGSPKYNPLANTDDGSCTSTLYKPRNTRKVSQIIKSFTMTGKRVAKNENK